MSDSTIKLPKHSIQLDSSFKEPELRFIACIVIVTNCSWTSFLLFFYCKFKIR